MNNQEPLSASQKTHLYFIVNTPLPNEQAHGIQIMQMCEAFTQQNMEVTLVIPSNGAYKDQDIFSFYKIPKVFSIKKISTARLPFWGGGRLAFMVRWISFSFWTYRFLRRHVVERDIIYVRGEMILPLSILAPKTSRLCFETHIKPRRMGLYLKAMKRCELIVTVTQAWATELADDFGVPKSKIVMEPDAVDLQKFTPPCSKFEARTQLHLPQDKSIIIYTGSDRAWKGLEIFKDSVTKLANNYLAVFVGNIEKKYEGDPRFLYVGHTHHENIPTWLTAADFVVLTGSPSAPESQRYTSPLKLFEYMAMKRPIIASDVPSFREIVDEKMAFFIPTNDGEGVARAITNIDMLDANTRAHNAYQHVLHYTWKLRSARILTKLG